MSAAAHAGLEDPVEPAGRALLSAEVAARWDVGFELAAGMDFSHRDHEPYRTCAVPLHERASDRCPPLVHLGPFEQLEFWTLHLEPRYRFGVPALGLHPFLGARLGLVR